MTLRLAEEWADAPDTEPEASARPLDAREARGVFASSLDDDGTPHGPAKCWGSSRKFRPGIDDDEPTLPELSHFIDPDG